MRDRRGGSRGVGFERGVVRLDGSRVSQGVHADVPQEFEERCVGRAGRPGRSVRPGARRGGGQEEVRIVESTVAVQLARQGEGGGDVGGSRAQEADADAGGDVRSRDSERNPPRTRVCLGRCRSAIRGRLEGDGFGGRRRRGGADAGTRETTARDMMTIDPRRDRGCADRRARATGSARRSSRPTKSSTTRARSLLSTTDARETRQQGAHFTKSLARGDAMSQQFESACLIHDRTVVEISGDAFLASLGIRSQSAVDVTTDAHVRRVGGVAGHGPRGSVRVAAPPRPLSRA